MFFLVIWELCLLKKQQKNPNPSLISSVDSLVTHTTVLLSFLCNLNKQVVCCSTLKLRETEMPAILGHIQTVKIGAGTSKKGFGDLPLKKHSLHKWANYILCNRCWGGNYKYSDSCYISPNLPPFLFSNAMQG